MGATQEVAAALTRKSLEHLKPFVVATPDDRLDWKPAEGSRSILSIVQEVATVNGWFAGILRTGEVPQLDPSAYETACAALDTREKALAALEANTAELVATIEAVEDSRLGDTITFPWGMTVTLGQALFTSQDHTAYHTGQVAYIQTLYGDTEMH